MHTLTFPKENNQYEKRRALLPSNVKQYVLMGAKVTIQSGLGDSLGVTDDDYKEAGAEIIDDRSELLSGADIVLSVNMLPETELQQLENKIVISFLDPFNNKSYVEHMQKLNVTSFSVEMLPRSTRCQKMDALSSQASLAGYVMVGKAMDQLGRIFPMMMTAAGTLKPAKVFVIGAGVAGLQAIATAKRLGAQVTAFDTRSVVAEQVQSLGAKFLDIDLGETGQTTQGYAQALTEEQMAIQKREQAKCIADSDVVITTAQLFGRKPPKLIDLETIKQMKPGSVIVDMAAENGGNVEGTVAGEITQVHGVSLVGTGHWAGEVASDASQMYANNLFNLVSEFWDKETKQFVIDLEDDIQQNALVTHHGELINEMIKQHMNPQNQKENN